MTLPVLEPVRRRRRRRRRSHAPELAAVALLVALALAALVWRLTGGGGGSAAPPAPLPKPVPAARAAPAKAAVRTEALVSGPALSTTLFAPPLAARAAVVIDVTSGRVVWAQRPHLRLPIASTTKILTATLVLQHLPLDRIVTIGPTVPRVPLVREGLRVGEHVPAWKLLDALLLYSGNDDALALAIATSGSRGAFITLMNQEAHRLGLRDSHFTSPSGVIDRGNYSSAWDLAALARYAMRDARFRRIVRMRRAEVSWTAPTYSKIYVNKNRMLRLYPGAIGIKTGWTTLAGPCVVAAARRHGVTLIAVVLDSSREYNDAARLLNLGFRSLG